MAMTNAERQRAYRERVMAALSPTELIEYKKKRSERAYARKKQAEVVERFEDYLLRFEKDDTPFANWGRFRDPQKHLPLLAYYVGYYDAMCSVMLQAQAKRAAKEAISKQIEKRCSRRRRVKAIEESTSENQ